MSQLLPILTVTQLNRQVKIHLESVLGLFQVEGEVSNLSRPASGHLYFTLKDKTAQVRCVFFKSRHKATQPLTEGQQIIVQGSLTLYEARGDYQLLVHDFTPAGLGALFQRFEALKVKLAAEGLFDSNRKKPLPAIPLTIGLVTSPSGAAIQDMLSTLARRFPLARIRIYPTEVQGVQATGQIIRALSQANQEGLCEVIILARGGGSLEDLWAFNEEALARTIAASAIPIITGIGHETDYSIADFVADYRAETPTAAANAATPDGQGLQQLIDDQVTRLTSTILQKMQAYQAKLTLLELRLGSRNPAILIPHFQDRLANLENQLSQSMQNKIASLQYELTGTLSTLHAVSPLATLDRGYAIATHKGKVLYEAQSVAKGSQIEVRLARGSLSCQVQETIQPKG